MQEQGKGYEVAQGMGASSVSYRHDFQNNSTIFHGITAVLDLEFPYQQLVFTLI